jgi:hypothetical protein
MPCGLKERSEDQQVGEGVSAVQATNALGKQRRHGEDVDLAAGCFSPEAESSDRIGHHDPLNRRVHDRGFGARHE